MIQEAAIWSLLDAIKDPELPVISIVELGIVRKLELNEKITLTLTPTFSACPAIHSIKEAIKDALAQEGHTEVDIVLQYAPPWTTDDLSEGAKQKLKQFGIAPPKPNKKGTLIHLDVHPVACPYCGGLDTEMKNTFGSTLCKSLYYCHSCQEPFEGFKTI